MLKRHAVHVLTEAGHTQAEIAELTGLSERSIRRIQNEEPVVEVDDGAERTRRRVGRPSKAEPYREFVEKLIENEPRLKSVAILRRVRQQGYGGGKSALYELVQSVRPKLPDGIIRFEGLPGEFTQHDFGEVRVHYLEGTEEKVQFFCSCLKYSRYVHVTPVDDQTAETLVRELCDHSESLGRDPARPGSRRRDHRPDSGKRKTRIARRSVTTDQSHGHISRISLSTSDEKPAKVSGKKPAEFPEPTPRTHHKHMRSTNLLERFNQEIKRRPHIVRIFPNAESCWRLGTALAAEQHEEWQEGSRYIDMTYCVTCGRSACGRSKRRLRKPVTPGRFKVQNLRYTTSDVRWFSETRAGLNSSVGEDVRLGR